MQAMLFHCRGTILRAPTQKSTYKESRQDIIRLARLTRKPGRRLRLQRWTFAALDGATQLRHHRLVEKRCAQCGAAMTCKPEGGCWCAELPKIPMPADAEGCLCRNCLLAKIEALQNPDEKKEA
jgi:hypothetical protein